jgi:hypothetical protein
MRTDNLLRRDALLLALGAAASFASLSACEAKPMTVTLDLVVFSYLNRPIFDVFISRKGGDSSGVYPETGGSTIAGVQLPLGPQTVTWRLGGPEGMARNGETVTAKNKPELKDVPKSAVFLALHIYPDDTVEITLDQHYPRPSPRGEVEIKKLKETHGK